MVGLACGLAPLTSRQLPVWQSQDALWAQAARVSPEAPRPLVNLAIGRMAVGEYEAATRFLDAAERLADDRPARDRDITRDLVAANRAVMRIREGRLQEARALVAGAPALSARWVVCQRAPGICDETR